MRPCGSGGSAIRGRSTGAAARRVPRAPLARRARPQRDRGAVTAEAALVIPSLVLVTLILAAAVSVVAVRLQVIDAAREAARVVARGEGAAQAQDLARGIAGPDAIVEVTVNGQQVRASVEAPALAHRPDGLLGALLAPLADVTISADSVAALEVMS